MKKISAAVFTVMLLVAVNIAEGGNTMFYAVSKTPTPVLSTSNFYSVFGGPSGDELLKERGGLIRQVEFIALPGTVFKVYGKVKFRGTEFYSVRTDEYPSEMGDELYVDSRFMETSPVRPKNRIKILQTKKEIIKRMVELEGKPYVWGGNIRGGVPLLLKFYPPAGNISREIKKEWILDGIDCSGLLYSATDGYTPRNTSSLVTYGKGVRINGLDAAAIMGKVRPLDILVWKGHVVIILDEKNIIESRQKYSDGAKGGVRIRPLVAALREVMAERVPCDEYPVNGKAKCFVIRRWYE
ncbi:MAG: peptidoglycan endopeptidase [Candidatus Omnitrophica bacterium]|nr:peptidoglycan endopeptidase [Candidatus Omnitrophota bacterium]